MDDPRWLMGMIKAIVKYSKKTVFCVVQRILGSNVRALLLLNGFSSKEFYGNLLCPRRKPSDLLHAILDFRMLTRKWLPHQGK